MSRIVLNDDLWGQLEKIMKSKGCKSSKNNRNVMEAILWKIRTGATWRDVPGDLCPWKTAYNRFNRWTQKGLWDKFFLLYQKRLIQSGYSSTEAMSAYISMLQDLGVESIVLSENLVVDPQLKYTWPVMRMEIRSVLKSLGVKCTTVKLHHNSSIKSAGKF